MSTTTPPPDGPEYLEQGGGEPAPPSSVTAAGPGRRTALVAGGAVAALALAGVGTWAALSFLGSGEQPAEALPASTLGYASVDLDPSGAQKIEALQMLRKFPSFEQEVGLEADDDVRRAVFDEALAGCDDVSFGDDVEPWLGSSFAVAAVEAGEEQPSPVFVVGVGDAAAAEDGLAALAKCSSEEMGWSIAGDWAVVAETDAIAQRVTDDAAAGTLADDSDYQEWMDQTGEQGVVSLYASPEAGPVLAEIARGDLGAMAPGAGSSAPEQMTRGLEEFAGAAATIRFADGALEMEVAGGAVDQPVFPSGEESVEVVGSLPDDTAVALGVALADGWGQRLLDQVSSMSGGQMTGEDLVGQAEAMTGLSLPEDLESLFGDSVAVALSGGFTLEKAMNSADGSDVPVGIKVQGDAAEVERVLGQLSQSFGPGFGQVLGSDSGDGVVAVGPDADYRSTLLADGGLEDTQAFRAVVPEADRSPVVLFVNFDAGDWVGSLAQGDPQVSSNLEPLDAFGVSVWQDDDTSHALLKLTTD
ncbi:MAG TPA: DUF3352 domain-containing protein [Nocardioides sp.]|nr:DUF3352 domain-containing protein [Nocardioides sp.]